MSSRDEANRFKFDWQRKVLACRLGAATTAVAIVVSIHANKHGGNSHAGVRLLAHETELGESTVRRCLEHLREVGLLERVMQGSRAEHRNFADVYELAMPDDLEDRVDVAEKPAEVTRTPNRGGKANHVRWHEKRAVTDPKCSYCAEAPGVLANPREGLARITGGVPEGLTRSSPAIRSPLGRNPTTAQTDADHCSVEEYQQGSTNTAINHHPATPVAAPRASSRGTVESVTYLDPEAYIADFFGGLANDEETTMRGMLDQERPVKQIINKIRHMRGAAA